MSDTANSDEQEIPKTEIILSFLAEQGPKTEYELYKQFPKLSHGTIHFCLNKLAQRGAITYVQSKHKKKQTKKQYHLTFIGTVTYVASTLYWQDLELTDSQIEERWKQFDEKAQEEIIEFLARQGKLLKYAIFAESKWLVERYPKIASLYAIIAHMICEDPPPPYNNLILVAKAIGKREKEDMPTHPEMIERLQDAYRREFNRLFLETLPFMRHNGKATTNLRLQRLAQEELEEEKHEASILELSIQLFGKQVKTK
jgi:DNA-binding PadR family transcriptional regulator